MSLKARQVFRYVKAHPKANTRDIITHFAMQWRRPRQVVCGVLSGLKRSKRIAIRTIIPRRYSIAR